MVINLSRRPDRLAHFIASYTASDAINHPLVRQPATDGSVLKSSGRLQSLMSPVAQRELLETERTGLRKHHSQLSTGAVGCYMSHIDAWKFQAEQTKPWLICEDDAVLHPRFIRDVTRAWNKAKATVDSGPTIVLFAMLSCNTGCEGARGDVLYPQSFWGLACYAIQPSTAKMLLERPDLLPCDVQIDAKLSTMSEALQIVAVPCVKPREMGTDIQLHIVDGAPLFRNGPI